MSRPNIVLILADDMSYADMEHMPKTRALFSREGSVEFSRAYVSTPMCCPSRATLLTGQYVHNHLCLGNIQPFGGVAEFRKQGNESSTVGTWLQDGGYRTALVGKYLNGYRLGDSTPPGWDYWRATGFEEEEVMPPEEEQTPALARDAAAFISQASEASPFFLWFSPPPPHTGSVPSATHAGDFEGARAPRGGSFDEVDVSDKPRFVSSKPRLTASQKAEIDEIYLMRIRTLQDLDDAVLRIFETLEERGILDETCVIFTSDNGYHLGDHRLEWGKSTAYETDIHVPLLIRGPGIEAHPRVEDRLVLSTDIAPTIAAVAGAQVPSSAATVDGRSLVPLLSGSREIPWRTAVLIEQYRGGTQEIRYRALRTPRYLHVRHPQTGEKETYNTDDDPDQLENIYREGPLTDMLGARLDALKSCGGDSCRAAENSAESQR